MLDGLEHPVQHHESGDRQRVRDDRITADGRKPDYRGGERPQHNARGPADLFEITGFDAV